MVRQNVQDWKEDYYKTTQDGSEAQTWTDFEEDCDAVNQARGSKINDNEYSAYQRVFGRNLPQMEDAILVRRSRSWGREQATNKRTGTRTVDDQETPCPPRKFSLGPQTSLETSPAPRCQTLQRPTACWTTPLVFGDVKRVQPRNRQTLFGTQAWSSISNTLATVWIAYRGSEVMCARSQVRPFHDDEAAHEHVTEHMRDLGTATTWWRLLV